MTAYVWFLDSQLWVCCSSTKQPSLMAALWTEQDHCATKQKLSSSGNSLLLYLSYNFSTNEYCIFVYRFCPQLSEDVAMDEKDDVKLVKILWETKVDMVKNNSKVCKLAQLLK